MSPKAPPAVETTAPTVDAPPPPAPIVAEQPKKAAPTVTKKTSGVPASKAMEAAKIAAAARAAILKSTGQKALGAVVSTLPHCDTGSAIINQIIGGNLARDGKGSICPGFPKQKIAEVYGAEASGKTTLTIAAAAAAQRRGDMVMFIDFENALSHTYAQSMGLDFDQNKLLYYTPDTLEEGMKMLYIGIKAGVSLVILDSVAAMVTKSEMEKKIDDPQRIGELAAALSRNLPKVVQWLKNSSTAVVLINQTRSLIQSGGYGDNDNSSGGKALKFYMSLRLKLTRIKSEVIKRKDNLTLKERSIPFGNVVQVKIVKNKMDKTQGTVGEVFIRYGSGLDEYVSVIECATARKLIKKDGAFLTFGELRFQGRDKLRTYLMANTKTYEELRNKVIKALAESAPEQLVGDDEIEDDDILANMQKDLGDDNLFDAGEEEAIEAIVNEEAG